MGSRDREPDGAQRARALGRRQRRSAIVGNDVYVVGYHGRAVGIDLETGVVLWQQDLSSYAGLGADINNVYVTNDFDAVVALDRDERHASSGGKKRCACVTSRRRRVTRTRSSSATTKAICIGFRPTTARSWRASAPPASASPAAPLVVGQNVYVQGDDGTVAAYTLRRDEQA